MEINNTAENNFILIIFGASGDLTKRKLIPALYDIYNNNILSNSFKIVGVGRKNLSDENFRKEALEFVSNHPETAAERLEKFSKHLSFYSMDTGNPEKYSGLKAYLTSLSGNICNANYLFYFAIPPFMYNSVAEYLYESGLTCDSDGWKRVIVEKPFGSSYDTALELNKTLLHYFSEDQIYRIDHYLGKETVQNILVTRFSNSIFEPLWNRNYIDYVEITSSETLGVGSRAGYYDTAGALRDMVQNHLLQLVGIMAMEPPINAEADSIRNEMVKVFCSLRQITPDKVGDYVVRGQYDGYRDEPGIKPDSMTETFVAMECYIDNWRWSGVPFYIRTGKRLASAVTEIAIHFRANPHKIFFDENLDNIANVLVIRIQPDEGMLLKIGMKIPGGGFEVKRVNMDFRYSSLTDSKLPSAYERLICDCIMGDATLFQRRDAVEATWRYVQPVLEAFTKNDIPLYSYRQRSWGPKESDAMIERDGREWREPCSNLDLDGEICRLG